MDILRRKERNGIKVNGDELLIIYLRCIYIIINTK